MTFHLAALYRNLVAGARLALFLPLRTFDFRVSPLDFCLLVTQRRHRDDVAVVAEGPAADEWLDIAQSFAGPSGTTRAALSRETP